MPLLFTFGSTPFGAGAFLRGAALLPAPAPFRVSKDRRFLRGLTTVASVEVDVNAAGLVVDRHAGVPPLWRAVPGLEAVACCLVWIKSVPNEGEARPGMMRVGEVLFGRSLAADRRHRLVVQDADYGVLHAYLTGAVRDAHQNQGHHWVGEIQDRPL